MRYGVPEQSPPQDSNRAPIHNSSGLVLEPCLPVKRGLQGARQCGERAVVRREDSRGGAAQSKTMSWQRCESQISEVGGKKQIMGGFCDLFIFDFKSNRMVSEI